MSNEHDSSGHGNSGQGGIGGDANKSGKSSRNPLGSVSKSGPFELYLGSPPFHSGRTAQYIEEQCKPPSGHPGEGNRLALPVRRLGRPAERLYTEPIGEELASWADSVGVLTLVLALRQYCITQAVKQPEKFGYWSTNAALLEHCLIDMEKVEEGLCGI